MQILNLLEAGWLSLLDYLAAHVILCLIPAFFIAGALAALVPQEAITRYLGPKASMWVSYPAAAVGGFVLAVCSCTILPLFAGIWKRGAGLGPAITFLFVGPAVNILAISYTGAVIGMDIALARVVLSVFFGISIGMIMAYLFRANEQPAQADSFATQAKLRPGVWAFFGLMVLLLIAGTLQIDLLTHSYLTLDINVNLPTAILDGLEAMHLSLQSALIVASLVVAAPLAWKGLDKVWEGTSPWTFLALAVVLVTLLIAAPLMSEANGLQIEITGRAIAVLGLLIALVLVAQRNLTKTELSDWLWETWKFIKQIFPLLIMGVFVAGVLKELIPAIWVQTVAGENTLLANFVGVVFGVFMYFPTLVEVPIAKMFLDMGMHRGPLLAYLMADPELSLQSILVTGRILGRKKTLTYVALVSVFSTLAGYLFGLVLTVL